MHRLTCFIYTRVMTTSVFYFKDLFHLLKTIILVMYKGIWKKACRTWRLDRTQLHKKISLQNGCLERSWKVLFKNFAGRWIGWNDLIAWPPKITGSILFGLFLVWLYEKSKLRVLHWKRYRSSRHYCRCCRRYSGNTWCLRKCASILLPLGVKRALYLAEDLLKKFF